jgi:hypothetical protein
VPRAPGAGGSKPFLISASDDRHYWCKAPNNPQGPMVPLNEQIVARLARLVGIAVCEPALIAIPSDLAGIQIDAGYILSECVAHGSHAVEGAIEVRGNLEHRSEDDNAVRHAGYIALHDWLWGGDTQWLRVASDANRYYSHDHGHFFPQGPNWTSASLAASVDTPHPAPWATDGLSAVELLRVADRLEALTEEEIAANVEDLPEEWPPGPTALAAIVDFSFQRSGPVADRIRTLAAM